MGKKGRLLRGISGIRKATKKLSKKDFNKIEKTIKDNRECPYCSDLIAENKACMESYGVKNNLRSITTHQIKCKDCRARIQMMVQCKKRGHK